jgi:hypothetical protein
MRHVRLDADANTIYSITSSASARSFSGTVNPNDMAIFMLITSSNLTGLFLVAFVKAHQGHRSVATGAAARPEPRAAMRFAAPSNEMNARRLMPYCGARFLRAPAAGRPL